MPVLQLPVIHISMNMDVKTTTEMVIQIMEMPFQTTVIHGMILTKMAMQTKVASMMMLMIVHKKVAPQMRTAMAALIPMVMAGRMRKKSGLPMMVRMHSLMMIANGQTMMKMVMVIIQMVGNLMAVQKSLETVMKTNLVVLILMEMVGPMQEMTFLPIALSIWM